MTSWDVALGEAAAVTTSLSWALAALVAQSSLARTTDAVVNFSKVAVALIGMLIPAWLWRGHGLPFDVPGINWFWLGLSGVIGFTCCDALMLAAFRRCGARTSLVIMTGAPVLAALGGMVLMGETLGVWALAGMLVTLFGIVLAVIGKKRLPTAACPPRDRHWGLLAAVGATIFQAAGFLLTKQGLQGCDSIAGTQIRLLFAGGGFAVLLMVPRSGGGGTALRQAWSNVKTAKLLLAYGILGPWLGMGLSLYAFSQAPVGIVSTIISTPPAVMVPLAMILYHEKVGLGEILGTVLAITGVALLFLN